MTTVVLNPGQSATLLWEANFSSLNPEPATAELTWTAKFSSMHHMEFAWTGYWDSRRQAAELSWGVSFSSYPSPPAINPQQLPGVGNVGGIYLTDDVTLTGAPGDVLSWSYSHDGRNEELQLTVAGLHGLATPTITLEAETEAGGVVSAKLGKLQTRTFHAQGSEPEEDHGAQTTSFTFRNSFDLGLRGIKLGELIPWVDDPQPNTWVPARTVNVSQLVHSVMRQVDPNFSLEDDPLSQAYWLERLSDYSTLDKTPEGVWNDTYGLLGMQLLSVPHGTGSRLVGGWLEPMGGEMGQPLPVSWVTGLTQKAERLQTPTSVTLTGTPAAWRVTMSSLPDEIRKAGDESNCRADKDAADAAAEEQEPSNEWQEVEELDGGGRTYKGFRTLKGVPIASVEFTLQDVVVTETGDGPGDSNKVTQTFQDVLTSYKETRISTDPHWQNRPVSEETVTKTFGYTLGLMTQSLQVVGPSIYTTVQHGYLLSDESATSNFRYNTAGEQVQKITRYRTLLSVEQVDAEEEPADRGPMTAREYGERVDEELFMPVAGGKTAVKRNRGGTTTVPVYDAESGEAVRTTQVATSLPIPIAIVEGRPPSFPLPPGADPCSGDTLGNGAAGEVKLVTFPVAVRLISGDAGQAEEQSIDLPFLPGPKLAAAGKPILTRQWWRIVTNYSLPCAIGLYGGAAWGGGRVRSVSISKDGSAGITSSVTVAALDPLMPISPRVEGVPGSKRTGSGVALYNSQGRLIVRGVTGTTAEGEPIWENLHVWFRGEAPSPGEEVTWRLNPRTGRREVG